MPEQDSAKAMLMRMRDPNFRNWIEAGNDPAQFKPQAAYKPKRPKAMPKQHNLKDVDIQQASMFPNTRHGRTDTAERHHEPEWVRKGLPEPPLERVFAPWELFLGIIKAPKYLKTLNRQLEAVPSPKEALEYIAPPLKAPLDPIRRFRHPKEMTPQELQAALKKIKFK